MQATVDAKALLTALRYLKPHACSKGAEGIRIAAQAGNLELRASDGDVDFVTTIPAGVTEPGVTIPRAKALADALKGQHGNVWMKGTDLELALVNDTTQTATGVPIHPVDGFPAEIGLDRASMFVVNLVDLAAVLPAAATTDNSRPMLCAVLFDGEDLVATDGYRLHHVVAERQHFPYVLVPQAGLAAMVKAHGGAGRATMLVAQDLTTVRFRTEVGTWTMRTVEGQLPNWRNLVPAECAIQVTVRDVTSWVAVIDEMRPLLLRDKPVHLTIRRTTTEIRVNPADLIAPDAKVPDGTVFSDAHSDGEADEVLVQVAYNPTWLRDALLAGGHDRVHFELLDSQRVAVLRSGNVMRLLMPMRVPPPDQNMCS